LSVAEATRECGMPRSTFYHEAQVYKNATYLDEIINQIRCTFWDGYKTWHLWIIKCL